MLKPGSEARDDACLRTLLCDEMRPIAGTSGILLVWRDTSAPWPRRPSGFAYMVKAGECYVVLRAHAESVHRPLGPPSTLFIRAMRSMIVSTDFWRVRHAPSVPRNPSW